MSEDKTGQQPPALVPPPEREYEHGVASTSVEPEFVEPEYVEPGTSAPAAVPVSNAAPRDDDTSPVASAPDYSTLDYSTSDSAYIDDDDADDSPADHPAPSGPVPAAVAVGGSGDRDQDAEPTGGARPARGQADDRAAVSPDAPVRSGLTRDTDPVDYTPFDDSSTMTPASAASGTSPYARPSSGREPGTSSGAAVAPASAAAETSRAAAAPPAPPAPVYVTRRETESAPQRVFVTPPVEPKKKSNRGVGSLLAVLAVIPFALLYAGVAALIILAQAPSSDFGSIFLAFISSPVFYVPAIFFVIGFVVVVLLVNRANWWAYVLGSLLVGLFVYFGTIGFRLVVDDVVSMTPSEATARFAQYAANPFVIAAALVAREVAIWVGTAIAARGRRMKARNLAAREDYERARASHQAEFEQGYAPAS